jgi:hypothetical protein
MKTGDQSAYAVESGKWIFSRRFSPDLLTFANFDHFYGKKSCFQGTKEALLEID